MVHRWQYAEGNHPAFCTCVKCESRAAERRKTQRTTSRMHEPAPPQRPAIRQPVQQYDLPIRKRSRVWPVSTIALLTIVVAYLVLTITAPEAIDSLMQKWARMFK